MSSRYTWQVEESYIGAEEFSRILKQEESIVLRGELTLLEALKYDLIVHPPYRALEGFCVVRAKPLPKPSMSLQTALKPHCSFWG